MMSQVDVTMRFVDPASMLEMLSKRFCTRRNAICRAFRERMYWGSVKDLFRTPLRWYRSRAISSQPLTSPRSEEGAVVPNAECHAWSYKGKFSVRAQLRAHQLSVGVVDADDQGHLLIGLLCRKDARSSRRGPVILIIRWCRPLGIDHLLRLMANGRNIHWLGRRVVACAEAGTHLFFGW